ARVHAPEELPLDVTQTAPDLAWTPCGRSLLARLTLPTSPNLLLRWYSAIEICDGASMTKSIQFTRQDTLHAAIGVIPAFFLIYFGYLTPGIAFAIGLLPTSLLGIAPSRKLRLIYGILGCLFGVGVYVGSHIVNLHNIWIAAMIFLLVSFAATIGSSKSAAGGLLLAVI